MKFSQKLIDGRIACYSKICSANGVAHEAALLYEFSWDECYSKGLITEGEFAKLVSIEFRIAFARMNAIRSHMGKDGFEELVKCSLLEEHGECRMVDDFGYRPWRFAA